MINNMSVSNLMRQAERAAPRAIAARWSDRTMTLGELRRRSNRFANALQTLGVPRQGAVAVVTDNRREWLEIDFALSKGGFVKVPVYSRLSGPEIAAVLRTARVRAVIADKRSAEKLVEFGESEPNDRYRICLDGALEGWLAYDDVLSPGSDRDLTVPVSGNDVYQIRFSTGSSGRPKGAVTTHAAARDAILRNLWVLTTQGGQPSPRTLVQTPLSLSSGWMTLPTLLAGGCIVIADPFSPNHFLATIQRHAISWTLVVPTMMRDLRQAELWRLRTSRLSCLVYAGEPASLPAIDALLEHTDSLVQVYGQTEAPSFNTYLSRRDHRDPALRGSVGRPVPGAEVSVLTAQGVASAGDGEIVIRSPSICRGLLGAESEHSARLLDDGWWRTGDLGHMNARGYAFVDGRTSDVIISGGYNVHPAELEAVLEQHPLVREAVVIARTDARWGERPLPVVYGPQLTGSHIPELLALMRRHLARFKVPDTVVIAEDPLPRTAEDGKLSRRLAAAALPCTPSSRAGS